MKTCLKSSLKLLKKIKSHGFEAYIVGGFVRDYYMNLKGLDVDICTNATPNDLKRIFKNTFNLDQQYGFTKVVFENIKFEITTYRKELKYLKRKPIKIEYINSLVDDLKRRDFTINTLCIDSEGQIIDLLNGINDIDKKNIKMIGLVDLKLKEDPLRMLRAIRFATVLHFTLDDNLKKAIIKHRHLLKDLSYQRKKDELRLIFSSSNVNYGLKLIKELKLAKELNLFNLENLKITDNVLGIWAQVDVLNVYPFPKSEKEMIFKIREVLKLVKIDSFTLYKYGLEIVLIASSIKGVEKKQIIDLNNLLPIKKRSDIKLEVSFLCRFLKKPPGAWIKKIYEDVESKIIFNELINDKKALIDYLKKLKNTL